VAFDLYDSDKRGAISPADVTHLLAASFRENGAVIADAAVARIVAETFRQYDVNRDGLLDFAEFRHMCTLQPNVLRPLTLNVSEMIAAHAGDAK
jgi:Ca2+-binding EF-hand superfamily protein